MTARHLRLPVAALLALASLLAAPAGSDAVPRQTEPPGGDTCEPANDYCVGAGRPGGGGGPGSGGGPGGGGGGGGGGGPVCTWTSEVPIAGDGPAAGLPTDPGVRPSPDAVLLWEVCEGRITGRLQWWVPGDPLPVRMTARALGLAAQARLAGSLPRPAVTSSPADGVAALVGFPSFITVDNWQDQVTDRECDPNFPDFCVGIVAQPRLTWVSGEPGDPAVTIEECDGPGVPFDPAGADPEVQAEAPGACAHTYLVRTGVEGRPRQWEGEVTVAWTLTYTSPEGSGTLPPVSKSTALPRAVDEVQTVVEDLG
jgi:hypothetical protein